MRCKACRHILFNQPPAADGSPRACSECGATYSVADHEFRRGKVQFCCPGCGTAYYGTSAKGHLEPAAFDCAGCGRALTMDACVVKPYAVARDDDAMQPTIVPWEQEGPAVRRWWETAKLGFAGAAVAIAPHEESKPRSALQFLVVTLLVTTIPSILLGLGFQVIAGRVGMGMGLALPSLSVEQLAVSFTMLLLAPLLATGFVAAVAGGASLAGVPFRRAFISGCYSSGALLLSLVPFCGGFIAWILWIVNQCRGASMLAPEGRRGGAVLASIVAGALWGAASLVIGTLLR
ncbi:MAG: hypothetical protein ACO3IB_01760 [Phycisphaerales bacterium]